MVRGFQFIVLSPYGKLGLPVVVAACRAGGLGVLDLEYVRDQSFSMEAIGALARSVRSEFGVKLNGDEEDLITWIASTPPGPLRTVLLTTAQPERLEKLVPKLREGGLSVLAEARCIEHAESAERMGVDGVVAKGHEGGGRVAAETTFVLLQRLINNLERPVWVQGGVGLHSVAACAATGAAGVVLDSQLALTRESPLAKGTKHKIASMDGSETVCLGESLGEIYRIYSRPGDRGVDELRQLEKQLADDGRPSADILRDWRAAIGTRVGWDLSDHSVLPLGQDALFAASLATRFHSVGGVLQGMREAIQTHSQIACRLRPLDEGSALARSHGTRYPIVQGPMTRVSDVPEFAARVAQGGALPFLALALMRGPEVKALLEEIQRRLEQQPWGVGILGFVPPELRQEQLEVIRDYRPPFALIAGGRPNQARMLERDGTTTYLHVPSPGLLKMFLEDGARRFVFEGRECGGHVGPRTSFVLWDQMIDVLLDALATDPHPEEYHVLFAAGIHDALSASMVAVMTAPLAERGVRVGVLMGTAYLFTEEAVASGAILKGFQEQAQRCERTVLLETGPGHATRCVDTPYAETFQEEKRRLSRLGLSAEEIRLSLEELNLGRLRIASKGTTRDPRFGEDPDAPKLTKLRKAEQLAQGMYMIGQVAALRNRVCTIAALHHDVAVGGSERLPTLVEHLPQTPERVSTESPSDIAVIGMACLLPKAPDLQTYWENILNKVDAITEVPKERWDWQAYFDADPKARDKVYSKWGGFLDDTPFDPVQYGMPPASLRSIEPAQLLTLEVVRAALKDAGYLERPFPRERTGVILGAGGGAADLGLGYSARAFLPRLDSLPGWQGTSTDLLERLQDVLPEWTEDSFAGILTNVCAGRVANRFDLGGTNCTVDAACAASLAAVSLAAKELEAHTSDMVIVGGVDTMQNPFTYLCFSKTHALSPRGRCRTFDESADGISISEGIGILVLKRLADAERDGDRIYAVIKGVGSSSDGKDRGLTAPRPEGQARALRRAYAKANIPPATVGLIEAHGTGTVAGDQAEVQALTDVFAEAGAERQRCAIGSVKSMIGHTKCTAGAAGLIKAALALYHKVLPPTLGVQKPNPNAHFPETPFYVNTEPRPWLNGADGHRRRAGVSAFGFGGTNFHVVVEEYRDPTIAANPSPYERWPGELFLWRAASREALLEDIRVWEQALVRGAAPELRDLALTSWEHYQNSSSLNGGSRPRLALIAGSLEDLKQKLIWARDALSACGSSHSDPRGIYFSERPLTHEGKVAFLFPGQGSQYPNMLRDLAIQFPEVRNGFESADQVLVQRLVHPLSTYIFPPPAFGPDEEHARQQALTQTTVAQPAMGTADMAMFDLLGTLGVRADMVAGHSYGEYVALCAAGVFSKEVLVALSEARGRFIVEAAGAEPGTMAAIEAPAPVVAESLKDTAGVQLANLNAPKQTVISGARAAVEQVVERLGAQGITARILPVACAFHSPIVAPAQSHLAEFLATAGLAAPEVTVYSNTTAAPYPQEPEAIATQLVEHLVRPVEFVQEIEAMHAAGARVFVEVGPRNVLTNLVQQILGDRAYLAVASDLNGRPGLIQLMHLLGQLAVQGVPVKLDRLFEGRSVRRLDLNALEKESAEQPLSPTAWLVNGARAKPVKETLTVRPDSGQAATALRHGSGVSSAVDEVMNASARAQKAAAVPRTGMDERAAGVGSKTSEAQLTDQLYRTEAPMTTEPVGVPATAALAEDGVPQVIQGFQQMMARFLDTQKSVMLSYLQGTGGAAVASLPQTVMPWGEPAATVPSQTPQVADPEQAPPATEPEKVVSFAAAAVSAEPAPKGVDKEQLTARLLAIVSERTGYPPEMLSLDLDLEADLGIDSIKRVEILGNFQKSFAAVGQQHGEEMMEKLAGVKTLRGIVDWAAERLGPEPQAERFAPALAEAVPASSTATVVDPEQLTARLLAIVSERTGYPPEMLSLDLDLEADLGIDSIKRVEILGNFQKSFAAAGQPHGEEMMEKLAGVKTLRGIVAWVAERLEPQAERSQRGSPEAEQPAPVTGTVATSVPSVKDRDSEDEGGIQRYTLSLVETPLERKRAIALAKGRVMLVTGEEGGVARTLVARLRGQGYPVAVLRYGDSVQEIGPGEYEADLSSLEAVAQVLERVRRRQGSIGGLVHLLPLVRHRPFEEMDFQDWKLCLQRETKTLFNLAKCLCEDLKQAAQAEAAYLIAATAMGGTLGSGQYSHAAGCFPGQGGILGLVKTLAQEWPEVQVKAVDLNLEESIETLAGHVLEELRAEDDQPEIAYDGSRRFMLQAEASALGQNGSPLLAIDSSNVILVTGGARGITAEVACRLAERYQPTLVLLGRSPLPEPLEAPETARLTSAQELKAALMEQMRRTGQAVTPARVEEAYSRLNREREIRANLAAMERAGARVHYYPTDVRDLDAFARLIDEFYDEFGRLDGVIHGAGVIEDKLIQDKAPDSFDRVFDTKVDSAWVLSRKLRPETLKFLVFFSSVAGRFGNRGQGDYAAANEVLNKLAVYLDQRWPGRVVSINWGPWAKTGMVSAELQRQFAERGVELIPPAVGLRRLEEELHYGRKHEVEVLIGGGGWRRGSESAPRTIRQCPLIGQGALVSRGTDGSMELVRKLDPAYDLYLPDHQLNGQPVLPLAMATELMAEVVSLGWPQLEVVSLRDLQVLHGIVLRNKVETIRVLATPKLPTGRGLLAVGVEIAGVEGSRRVHYRATVDLAEELPAAPPFEPWPLTEERSLSMNVDDLYRQWLFHGPFFQGITRVEQLGANGIKAALKLSTPQRWITDAPEGWWLIDPLMLDSGLQLLILWVRKHWDMTTLPSRFQAYHRFATPSSAEIQCELRIRPETGGHAVHGDLWFFDAEGRVVGLLEDIEGTCSRSLNRLVGVS